MTKLPSLIFAMILALTGLIATIPPAFAQSSIDLSDLSQQEIDQLKRAADEYKKNNTSHESVVKALTDPEQLSKWAEAGQNLGKALAGAARELGTGAMEFSRTWPGIIVTSILLWTFVGKSIVLLGFSIFFLVFMNLLGVTLLMRRMFPKELIYLAADEMSQDDLREMKVPKGAKLLIKRRISTKYDLGEDDTVRNFQLAFLTIFMIASTSLGVVCIINI